MEKDVSNMQAGDSIIDPKVGWDLLSMLPSLAAPQQQKLFSNFLESLQRVMHNRCLLPPSFTSSLIAFALSSAEDSVYLRVRDLISYILRGSASQRSMIRAIFENVSELKTADLLSVLLKPGDSSWSYFYFSGESSGLFIDQFPCQFPAGFACCIWVRIENTLPKNAKLFSFSEDLNCSFEGHKLFYRVRGRAVLVHDFNPKEWTCIGISHSRAGKSTLNIVVNGEDVFNASFDFEKTGKINQCQLCTNMLGQMAAVLFFNAPVPAQNLKTLHSYYQNGAEGIKTLEKVIDKSLQSKLCFFFHPSRTQGTIAFDAIGKNDAVFGHLTGAHTVHKLRLRDIGGVQSLLNLVNFKNNEESLEEWLNLVVVCFKDRPENQLDACKAGFFQVLAGILIKTHMSIQESHVILLEELDSFMMPQLRKQLALHLLLAEDLWKTATKGAKIQLSRLLEKIFTNYKQKGIVLRLLEIISCSDGLISQLIEDLSKRTSDIKPIINYLLVTKNSETQLALIALIRKLKDLHAKSLYEMNAPEVLIYTIKSSENAEIRTAALGCLEYLHSDLASFAVFLCAQRLLDEKKKVPAMLDAIPEGSDEQSEFSGTKPPPAPSSKNKKISFTFPDEPPAKVFSFDAPLSIEENLSKTAHKPIKSFGKSRKLSLTSSLKIDTDEINENYHQSQEQSEEDSLIKEIQKLVNQCLEFMDGDKEQDEQAEYFPLPPRPDTMKGVKNIDFSTVAPPPPITELSVEGSPSSAPQSSNRQELYQEVLKSISEQGEISKYFEIINKTDTKIKENDSSILDILNELVQQYDPKQKPVNEEEIDAIVHKKREKSLIKYNPNIRNRERQHLTHKEMKVLYPQGSLEMPTKMNSRCERPLFSVKRIIDPIDIIDEFSGDPALITKHYLSDKSSVFSCEVTWITPSILKKGNLQILKSPKCIKFIYDISKFHLEGYKSFACKWAFSEIRQVIPKYFNLEFSAAEFYFKDGSSFLCQFESPIERSKFLTALSKFISIPKPVLLKNPDPKLIVSEEEMTYKWLDWKISNFQYLMYLNFQAGRSYNDHSQYPVLPWVFVDYKSETLNLEDQRVYRDLSKNMLSLGSNERFEAGMRSFEKHGFHSRNSYSETDLVQGYLDRKSFKSINEAYYKACNDPNNVGELIPEMFNSPEIFANDIQLPRWSRSSYDFIRIHRQGLESDIVSQSLHCWIDLIFGYKQSGKEAETAHNLFNGMIPIQLFTSPHPMKKPRPKAKPSVVSEKAHLKVYLPFSKRTGASALQQSNSFHALNEQSIVKAGLFRDRELYVCRLNGSIAKYSWKSVNDSKTPFTCKYSKEFHSVSSSTVETRDRSLSGFNAPILILNEGKLVIQGGFWDGRLVVTSTHSESSSIWKHQRTVTCLDSHDSESIFVSGSKGGDTVVWKINDGNIEPLWHFFDHSNEVSSISVCQDLLTFATASIDGTCNLYMLSNGKHIRQIQVPNQQPAFVVKMASAPPAKIIIYTEHTFYSFSINGSPMHRASERCAHVISAVVVQDLVLNEFLFYGTESGEIVMRNTANLEQIRRHSVSSSSPILNLLVTADLRFLIIGDESGQPVVLADPDASRKKP